MSLTYSVNNAPANGTIAMYALISLLISAGWVKTADSDGTTYSSVGTRVTGSGSGANGFGNASAWIALRSPDSTVFLVVQRSADTTYRVKIASTAFSGGTPGATQVGSSTTEIIWLGSGTDAAPGYTTAYTTNNTYKQHLAADNAAPWGFYQLCATNTTGTETTGTAIFDPVVNCPAADTRQWVIWGAASGWSAMLTSSSTGTNEGNNAIRGWLGFATTPSVVGLALVSLTTANATISNGAAGFNSNTNLEDTISVPFARAGSLAAPVGWKGVSSLVQFSMSTIRSSMSTLNTGGVIDHVIVGTGGYVLPWPNTTPVL